MEKNLEKSRKFNIVIYLLTLIALFVMVIGTSYAYYVKKIKNGDTTRVIIKSQNMLIRFFDGSEINAEHVTPGWEDTYKFSIENYSPDTVGKYRMKLEIINPLTNTIEENFTYQLSGKPTKNNGDKLVSVSEKAVPVSSTELGTGEISIGSLHEYELKLQLKENNQDQNYLMGKTFVAKVVVEYIYE